MPPIDLRPGFEQSQKLNVKVWERKVKAAEQRLLSAMKKWKRAYQELQKLHRRQTEIIVRENPEMIIRETRRAHQKSKRLYMQARDKERQAREELNRRRREYDKQRATLEAIVEQLEKSREVPKQKQPPIPKKPTLPRKKTPPLPPLPRDKWMYPRTLPHDWTRVRKKPAWPVPLPSTREGMVREASRLLKEGRIPQDAIMDAVVRNAAKLLQKSGENLKRNPSTQNLVEHFKNLEVFLWYGGEGKPYEDALQVAVEACEKRVKKAVAELKKFRSFENIRNSFLEMELALLVGADYESRVIQDGFEEARKALDEMKEELMERIDMKGEWVRGGGKFREYARKKFREAKKD